MTSTDPYLVQPGEPLFDGPADDAADPRELLLGYLDWYRDAALRKLEGLSDSALRTPVAPLAWAPLGLVKHLGWVERRWLRWGFAAEQVPHQPPGGRNAEFLVASDESAESVLTAFHDEVNRCRAIVVRADLADVAAVGGRFPTADRTPTLGRILFHLLQEYARHLGHLDIVAELAGGPTGE